MKYIIAIYSDGVCGKFEEGTDVYERLVPVILHQDSHFTPYDDSPDLPQNWMDVAGMVGKARLFSNTQNPQNN